MAKQDVTVELFYNAVWNDHTTAALVRDQIQVTRGASGEQQQPPPAKATLTLTGWRFNPDNVSSDLFGLIGRNTPLRVTVGTDVRFVGEVSSWTPRQSLGSDQTADRWVQVAAAGVTRRLGQGADPLRSAPERFAAENSPLALWPLDDGPGSRSSRAVVGQPLTHAPAPSPLTQSHRPGYGNGSVAPWLGPAIKLTTDEGAIAAPISGSTTGGWVVDAMYRADQSTTGGVAIATQLSFRSEDFEFRLLWGDTDGFAALVDDSSGNEVATDIAADDSALLDGQPHHIRWEVTEAAGDTTRFQLFVDGVEEYDATLDIGDATTPAIGSLNLTWTGDADATAPVQLSTLAIWNNGSEPALADAVDAGFGHAGEHAGRRIQRLLDEEGVASTFTGSGDLDDSLPCGPQYPDGFLPILREAAQVDLGDLLDARTSAAVNYRTGRTRYNQTATLELDYVAKEVGPPLDPVVDDQATRNDVTAQRRDGGQQRAVDESGPLGVDSIGRYQTSVTVNTPGDGHSLASQAGWRLHLGTVGGTRFPRITVDLDATPSLAAAASDVDAGHLITVDNLPTDLTPDLARLLALGYTETIGSHRRKITFNCAPEEPYHIAEVEHDDYAVIGSSSATLDEALTDSETGVDIDCGAGPEWVHEADFDIRIGGERMTVTAVGAASGTFPARKHTLTVTRSVNGVVKSHATGTAVRLFHQSYIGL